MRVFFSELLLRFSFSYVNKYFGSVQRHDYVSVPVHVMMVGSSTKVECFDSSQSTSHPFHGNALVGDVVRILCFFVCVSVPTIPVPSPLLDLFL